MSKNQIKVSSLEELLAKTKEYVASQGGADKVRIGNISSNSGYYTYTKNGLVQTSKGKIELELKGQGDSLVEFFLEVERERGKGGMVNKIPNEFFKELNKIIPNACSNFPQNTQNKNPDKESDFQPHSLSVHSIPCSSIEEAKKKIKEFYQKNQDEINKNSDFDQWIEITEIGIFSEYSEVGKNGETISSGPHNTATIFLKGTDQNKNGKIVNESAYLLLKVKSSEWKEESIDWPKKELENCWNKLLGKKENASPENPVDKKKNEIENLRQEIKELEKNQVSDNSKKELKKKIKKLSELERSLNNNNTSNKYGNSNLVLYLSLGGIVVILVGVIMVWWSHSRKNNKK